MKRKISLLVAVLVLCFCGLFFYIKKNSDNIDIAFTVKNETEGKIDTIGIAIGNKYILNRTNGKKFYFPKYLIKREQSKAIVFSVFKNKVIAKTGEIDLKGNKEVSIKKIKKGKLFLDVTTEKTYKNISIPRLDTWKVRTDKRSVKGSYETNTDMKYTLYLLGKGGCLGISGTETKGKRVIVSWEKPKYKIDSWLVFDN